MKIGIISDIHGNNIALEAVLRDCKNNHIDELMILGDLVGYYYHPNIVLDLLSGWKCEFIKGNHEVILQNMDENKISLDQVRIKYGIGHELALKTLGKDRREWLYSLPTKKSLVINNISFQLNHGSPRNYDEYLYPNSEHELLENCDSAIHDFVLVGHSHYAFFFRCSHSTLINCGSVGQSRQRGGQANWAVVNTDNKCVVLQSTPYDVRPLLEEIHRLNPEFGYSAEVLTRNVKQY